MRQFVIILSLLTIFSSCANQENKGVFDFGVSEFEEPFRGPIKNKPGFLVNSLMYPPYKWVSPDTVTFNKCFKIEFNEDAIRSHSTARISFVDSLYNPIPQLRFYVNGVPFESNTCTVVADSLSKVLHISCKVHPSLGEACLAGHVVVSGTNLDMVNSESLHQDENIVSGWQLEYRYDIPWLLWFLWLLTAVILCAVVGYFLYLLVLLLVYLVKLIASGIASLRFSRIRKVTNVNVDLGKRQDDIDDDIDDDDDHNHNCPCDVFMRKYCRVLMDPAAKIADIAPVLLELTDRWEDLTVGRKEDIYSKLCPCIKELLDDFWSISKKVSQSNGIWKGDKFYFNDDYVPAEYNNRGGRTWKQLVADYNKEFGLQTDGGVRYHNRRIDLAPYAIATVTVRYDDTNLSRGGSEDSLQEVAAPFFESLEQVQKKITEGGYKNFWEYKSGVQGGRFRREGTPLVIHEDYDCKTLMLVPKYLHDNWRHYGGIRLAQVISRHLSRRASALHVG